MNKSDLVTIILKLHRFCKEHHDLMWAVYFDELLNRINSAKNTDEIKSIFNEDEVNEDLFGDMYSLYDLYICKENGHIVEDVKAANLELEKLRRGLRKLIQIDKADVVTIISKLYMLCKSHHDFWWATYFDELQSRINSVQNIDEIVLIIGENPVRRQIFGGMGSLNDLWICKENGHIVEDEKAANQELEKLRRGLRRLFPGYY